MNLMQRRRALMAAKKTRLPSGYQEVEWIESSGTQGIITPCWLKQSTDVYCEFQYTSTGSIHASYPQTFGCASPSLGFSRAVDTGSIVYVSFGNQTDKTIRISVSFHDAFHAIRMTSAGTVIDDAYSVSYTATVTENSDRKIALFARISSSNIFEMFSCRKIKVFQLREGGTLVLDLVPCYRKADNEIGMYDLVSKTFLTNAGTGTFTKGADVN